MTPYFGEGGNRTVSAGPSWVRLADRSRPCRQVTIVAEANDLVFRTAESGDESAAFPVLANSYYTVFGVTDLTQVWVKRKDGGAAVTVSFRWEAP